MFRSGIGNLTKASFVAVVFVLGVTTPGWPQDSYRLFLQPGGSLCGEMIDGAHNTVTVAPNQAIAGTVQLRHENDNNGGAIVPVEYTPSWGNHADSWRVVTSHGPLGTNYYAVPISLMAPAQIGTYFIIFGSLAQFNGGYISSMTSWTCGAPAWGDGNDLADLPESAMAEALASGWVWLPGWECTAMNNWPTGLTFVKVVVGEPTPSQERSWGQVKSFYRP